MIPSIRQTNLLIFLGCAVPMIIAVAFLEHVLKLDPCPLCITQRAFFVLTGILAIIAFVHNPSLKGIRIYAILGIISALGGSYIAGHQLHLQSLPADQVPACGPGLAYMLEVFPLMEAFKMMLQGDGSCAELHKILGLSIAGWSLIAFIGLAAFNLWQVVRSLKNGAVSPQVG